MDKPQGLTSISRQGVTVLVWSQCKRNYVGIMAEAIHVGKAEMICVKVLHLVCELAASTTIVTVARIGSNDGGAQDCNNNKGNNNNTGNHTEAVCVNALQLVSGQAVGTLFDLEESQYMQERMEAERHNQGTPFSFV